MWLCRGRWLPYMVVTRYATNVTLEEAVEEIMKREEDRRLVCRFEITKRSHTQLHSRKQVIAFQDRVITINIKEAQHPLK